MAESHTFSVGVDDLLLQIRPYGKKESNFPPGYDEPEARRRTQETLREWFVRVVDQFCHSDPKRAAMEDNIAVFIRLGWRDRRQLIYASVQTIVVACDLKDYYDGQTADEQYLRLDFDYQSLGEPFSHPLPHVHLQSGLSPRFALEGGHSGNIVMDYLEFIYRNYVPQKWLTWAKREWDREFLSTANSVDVNHFEAIVDAFARSQFHVLRNHSVELARIKRTLRRRKDESFPLHMNGADREILEYPLAR